MVPGLGNAPSQDRANSFTDCPASLTEYPGMSLWKGGSARYL